MKVGSKWFTIRMALFTILCAVAIAPAAERDKMIAVGGNDGMLLKQGVIGVAPSTPSRVPVEGHAPQTTPPQRLQGRPDKTAEDIDTTDDQDPLQTPPTPVRSSVL